MRWLLFFFFASICQSAFGQNWTVMEAASLPEAVSNNAVCEGFSSAGSFVYSFTGIDSTLASEGIHLKSWRVNTQTLDVQSLPDVPDTLGKIAAAASEVNGVIYILGGYHVLPNENEVSSDKVHRFDVAQNQFIADGNPIPIPIDDHVQAVYRDSLIFVVTGWSNTGNVPDVQIYNTYTDTWAFGMATPNSSRYTCFGASGTILGDTIYYYGGAAGFGFAARSELRKGYINPNNPTDITWSESVPNPSTSSYRNAACNSGSVIHWLGGSETSYNFNAIAYNGSGLVEPSNTNAFYHPGSGLWAVESVSSIPMDLRGIANISDNRKYLLGGIGPNGKVSKKILRLDYSGTLSASQTLMKTMPFLSPNPASNYIISSESGQLKVFDSFGRLILQKNVYKGEKLEITELAWGVYLAAISVNEKMSKQRLIIAK